LSISKKYFMKDGFISKSADAFVISSNIQTLYFPELENLIFGDCKFDSLEACKGKKAVLGLKLVS
jgi:hypothetical protein